MIDDLFSEVLVGLESLEKALQVRVATTHNYEIPSQSSAKSAEVRMAQWFESGNAGIPPGLSSAEFRAAIYDGGRSAAQLRAYRQVSAIALMEHVAQACSMLSSGRMMLGFSALRGIIERAGMLAENTKKLAPYLSDGTVEFARIIEGSEIISRTLYSTRLDWHKLVSMPFERISSKEREYKKLENTVNLNSINVLNGVDTLDKRCVGTRAAYEILCEFLHPNMGDLISATVGSKAYHDAKGTKHIRRVIGRGPSNISGQADMQEVLGRVIGVCNEITSVVPGLLCELDQLCSKAFEATQREQHKVLRSNRDLFGRGDPCPCLSGKSIRHCAPAALKAAKVPYRKNDSG